MKGEQSSTCAECGASVYREHLDSGIARYEGNRLLCSFCVADYETKHDSAGGPAQDTGIETISLQDDDDDLMPAAAKSRIHNVSKTTLGEGGSWSDQRFKRPLDPQNGGASRCRTFHSKLNEGSIDFMTKLINDWLDGNEQIVIKFSTSCIGVFEGKHAEPNLIVTLFY